MILDLPYQRTGAEWLASQARAGLADEQGVGKTVQAIMACDMIGAKRIAVVCPAKMIPTWRAEFDDKGRTLAYRKLRVMSWEEATKVFTAMKQPTAQGGQIADVIILDEAHYLKNLASKRTKAIYPKTIWARHVWALTGTPCPNGDPSELYPHFFYLKPHLILAGKEGPMTYDQFRRRFCVFKPGFGNVPKVVGVRDVDKLRSLNQRLWLRRMLSEVQSQLPTMRYGEVILEADKSSGAAATQAGSVATSISRADYDALLVSPDSLPDDDEDLSRMRRLLAIAKAGPLAGFVAEELENNPREKLVIFAWHTEAIDILRDRLRAYRPVVVDGRTSGAQTKTAVDAFQTNPNTRVFIGQIAAAGTGLTLTAASNVIFLECSWKPGENDQAARRILRIGQTATSCLCRFAILKDSVDQAVTRVLARKSRMAHSILQGAR